MKRVSLHIIFWAAYLAQAVLLSYLWNAPKLSEQSINAQVNMAIINSLVYLLPKLFFTYFMLYFILNDILNDNGKLWKNIAYIVLAMISTLLLYRILAIYIAYPFIYHGLLGVPELLSPLGLLANLMDLGFASGAAIFIKQLRLQLAGKELEKTLIKEKLETELKFLKNQTNPHFLFNTLNNIYALARKKSDSTADVVMKLSKILRFMLYESGKPFITIVEEIKLIEDYLDLEKIRYNDRLNISFTQEIDNNSQPVSPLLLLPFVENAFKHGVSETRFTSFVKIDLKLCKSALQFVVENSREKACNKINDNKIGLGNIKRQLELMYKEFELRVEEKESTFIIYLMVNLNSHEKI